MKTGDFTVVDNQKLTLNQYVVYFYILYRHANIQFKYLTRVADKDGKKRESKKV
jgi:hypothetical protein